jgi:hypothetical protein
MGASGISWMDLRAMKRAWLCLIAICLALFALGMPPGQVAQAQSDSLSIGLLFPNEGETFYASPLTFIYSFKLRGWVESSSYSPEEIEVEVQIIQDGRVVNSKKTKPDADGLFTLPTTVNPNSNPGSFTQFQTVCRIDCHYKTDFQLPEGPVTLELTATAPDGSQASLVRHIQVDLSKYITLPVQVTLEGDNIGLPGEIPVTASTRLYLWRARNVNGTTDEQGRTELELEVLSQAETRYVFRVEPAIIDGIYYEGVEPVEVILPPGASSAETVNIRLRARRGEIQGLITAPDGSPAGSMEIQLIQIPEGASRSITTSPDGTFLIKDLPVDSYTITANPDLLAEVGYAFPETEVDLTTDQVQTVNVSLDAISGEEWHGAIMDDQGKALPFAWITLGSAGRVFISQPGDGSITLHGMPAESKSIIVLAPGYYSQTHQIDPGSDPRTFVYELSRRPDTTSIPWGDGEIVIPSESTTEVNVNGITLINGWVWGNTQISEQKTIHLLGMTIVPSQGQFALEYNPASHQGWLYIINGEAGISGDGFAGTVELSTGQMAALIDRRTPRPIPYDPVTVSVFRESDAIPVQTAWEPTIIDRIRNQFVKIGIGTAQVLTLATYVLILVSIVLVPILGLVRISRKSRKKQ